MRQGRHCFNRACSTGKTVTKKTVQWTLDPRTPRGAQSCDTVCADASKTCDQSSLDNLNNNDAAFAAAFEAWKPGHCKKWHTGCASGNNCARWGSPFIHSSHVKDNLCWKGSPVAACGQRPVDGHHRRLCPCSSSTTSTKADSDDHTTPDFYVPPLTGKARAEAGLPKSD
jgi:hypothetical protein